MKRTFQRFAVVVSRYDLDYTPPLRTVLSGDVR